MGSILKRLILSAGALLGVFTPSADPVLLVDFWKTEQEVVFNLIIEDSQTPPFERVLMSGNPLVLSLNIQTDHEIVLNHILQYDPAQRLFYYTDQIGRSFVFGEKSSALIRFFSFMNLNLLTYQDFERENEVSIDFKANILVQNSPDIDDNWLWDYKPLTRNLIFKSLTEIPY